MKALCPLLFFIISTPLWSKPQLEFVSDFVSPVNMTIYNFEEAIPMPDTGENIIWDYSSYNFTEAYPNYFEVMETTDFDADFPEATLIIKRFSEYFSYNKFDEDEYTYLGNNNFGTSTILTNPNTYYELPFEYNESKIDTFQLDGEPESVSLREYLGYGNLITAHGTYSDVILIHVKETIDDEVEVDYYTIISPLTFRGILVYWIDPNFLTNTFSYDPVHFTDISESNNDISAFSIFPNPVTDKLNIDINNIQGDYSISLFSIDGRKIKDFMDIDNLNISEIPAGNYFIQLTTLGGCFTQKIVKL